MKPTISTVNTFAMNLVVNFGLYKSGLNSVCFDAYLLGNPFRMQFHVAAYFAGHDHNLEHLHPAGETHYFVSGAGAKVRFCTEKNDGFCDYT